MKKQKKKGSQSPKRKKRLKLNKSRLIVTVIVIALIAVVGMSLKNVISLHIEQNELKAKNEELKEEKSSLKDELKDVNDYSYIEEQARIQLRLIKPGETLYILGGSAADDAKNSDSSKDDNE